MKRLLAAGFFALFVGGAVRAQSGAVENPEPTGEGRFDGTWYYVDPSFKIALFFEHDKHGLLTMRYQVRPRNGAEFQTNAKGVAEYLEQGLPVRVRFTGKPNQREDLITGHYERTVDMPKGRLIEGGDYKMFRSAKGKNLVLQYPVYTFETKPTGGRATSKTQKSLMRIYRKASEIVLDFDEIPF